MLCLTGLTEKLIAYGDNKGIIRVLNMDNAECEKKVQAHNGEVI